VALTAKQASSLPPSYNDNSASALRQNSLHAASIRCNRLPPRTLRPDKHANRGDPQSGLTALSANYRYLARAGITRGYQSAKHPRKRARVAQQKPSPQQL